MSQFAAATLFASLLLYKGWLCACLVRGAWPPDGEGVSLWPRCLTVPRDADLTIGPPGDVYLRRWHVIPRNGLLNIFLHQFLRSDDPRALHDHPYANISIILRGFYIEVMPDRRIARFRFRPIFRSASAAHRIELVGGRPVWSLFITGPHVREWGFHCPNGWRHHADYIAVHNGGNQIGRGCA